MVQGRVHRQADIDDTIEELQRFALGSLRASAAIFYWIDDTPEMQDAMLTGVPAEHFARYRAGMKEFDPLNVKRLTTARKRIAMLHADRGLAPSSHFARYRAFLRESTIVDVMDLVFWHDGFAFAGLGILKTTQDPPFDEDAMRVATAMQPYIEFNLGAHPRLKDRKLRHALVDGCGLTPREVEVTELVRWGCTNHDIADELRIALATVKTHLIRIFEKLAVENRTALVSRLNLLETVPMRAPPAVQPPPLSEMRAAI